MSTTQTPHDAETVKLPVGKIQASGLNPRKSLNDETQAALTESVRQLGVVTPITVRRSDDGEGWTLMAGQRRLLAAMTVGLEEIPALVLYEEDDERRRAISIVENLHRDPLKPMEEAHAFKGATATMSQTQIAAAYSISEQTVRDRIGLLSLPESLHEHIDSGAIPISATRVIAKIAEFDERYGEACAIAILDGKVGIGQFASSPAWALQQALRIWNHDNNEDALLLFPTKENDIVPEQIGWTDEQIAQVAEDARIVHGAHEWTPLLSQEDVDAARTYGCLLELTSSDGEDVAFITDSDWLFEYGSKALAAKAQHLRENPVVHQTSTLGRSTTTRVKKADMSDEQRAEFDRQRQADAERRAEAIIDNEQLGAKLLAKFQPKLDKRSMMVLALVIGDQWADSIGRGCRYTVSELRTVTEKKGGGSRVEYASGADGYEWWVKRLKRLKTPEEILHHVLFGLAASEFCDEEAVAQSNRSYASPAGHVGDGEVGKLLLALTRASVPARMKERTEERQKREAEYRASYVNGIPRDLVDDDEDLGLQDEEE